MDVKNLIEEVKQLRGELTETLKTRDNGAEAKFGALNEKAGKLFEDIEGVKGQIEDVYVKMGRPDMGGGSATGRAKSIGSQFIESESYKRAMSNGLKSTDSVEVEGGFHRKAILSTDTGGNLLGETQFESRIVMPSDDTFRLRDVMTVQSTSSGAIEYVEETGFTNAAAPVIEAALKPESDLTYELRTANVKTIAHTITASNQVLSDANQLRGMIDQRMGYGVKLSEEAQILYGSGAGENLQGVLTNANRQIYSHNVSDASDPGVQKIRGLRHAMTLVRLSNYPVEGVVVHPSDWEDIELASDSNGRFIILGWGDGAQMRFFRVPVVDSTAINPGEAAVGAFKLALTLYDREQSNIRVFEQHVDYAQRNLVLIRGEERLALVNYRPEAIAHVTFNSVV